MKTKYEQFFEQVLHSFDEPKKNYPLHAKVGFRKQEELRQLKFQMMSATKIFLSNDFIYKDYYTWKEKTNKLLGKHFDHKKGEDRFDNEKYQKTQKAMREEVQQRKKLGVELNFRNALPIYDDCVIIFPREDTWRVSDDFTSPRFEFMNLIWIKKLKRQDRLSIYNYDRDQTDESIVDRNDIYNISAFDNREFVGRQIIQNLINENKINDEYTLKDFKDRTTSFSTPWLRTDIFPSIINFDGGSLYPTSQMDSFKHIFPHHPIEVRKEFEKFIRFSLSPLCQHKCKGFGIDNLNDEFMIDYLEEDKYETHRPFMRLGNIIALLAFINKKGSETIAFKSHLPIKKRSNVIKGFEYKMLEVKKTNRITTRFGDSINKNRLHWVRRHTREYKNGKTITIHPHQRGDEKMGIVIKDYNFK